MMLLKPAIIISSRLCSLSAFSPRSLAHPRTHTFAMSAAASSSAAGGADRRIVPIEVISDTICPWCYIGKKRLEAALADAKTRFPHLEFDVRWRPFELNSNLPKGKGYDKLQHYEEKFGAAMVRNMIPQMKAVAEEYGIQMDYGGHVGNTFDSHRLIWKAREVGGSEMQDKVVNELFRAYFEEKKSLGEQTVLEECASKAGLHNKLDGEIADFLTSKELGTAEVQQEKQEFGRAYQCTGVPMFIVDGKMKLSGAQEPNAFLRVFGQL